MFCTMSLKAILISLSLALAAEIIIPPLSGNGTYGVGLSIMALTDTSRQDPFAPTPQPRQVVVSAFFPTAMARDCDWHLVPYMSNATAAVVTQQSQPYIPNGTLESIRLTTCTPKQPHVHFQDPSDDHGKLGTPLILFSPGMGNPRLEYSAMAQAVASHGYVVVTIDHPYDASVVEFPDGHLVLAANITSLEQIAFDVQVRAADASFVLTQLGKAEIQEQLLPKGLTNLNTRRAAMFGHSLGGATTASAMLNDSRIVGGVNLDGTLFGPVIDQGLKDPLILWRHDVNESDPTWQGIWPHLDWKQNLLLLNSTHGTFTDLPVLAQLIGEDPATTPLLQPLLGSLGGVRGLEIMTAYLVAFFDMVLKCSSSDLLQGPSPAYPEVVFRESP